MRTKFSGILTLLLAFVVQIGFAQQKTISGTVTDDSGLPLPGVNVLIKNTSSGTQTDFDGNYSISANQGDVLEFSYVGFTSQEIKVGASNNISVSLKAGEALEEVIVTGYRKQSANEMTGNSIQISSEEISAIPLPTVDQALQGKVAGLQISQSSGTPGSIQDIRVRGISSFSAGNNPLYVIDGVPVSNVNLGQLDADDEILSSSLSPIASLNNEDIESITVLKDASATAAYGARGSNGVIVITTKKGKSGETKFSFSTSIGVSNDAYNERTPLSDMDRIELLEEGIYNAYHQDYNITKDQALQFGADNDLLNPMLLDHKSGDGYNWSENIKNKDAFSQTYNFSANGGDEKGSFYASLGYNKTEATVKTLDFERLSGALNFNRKLRDNLDLETSINLSNTKQNPILEGGSYFSNPFITRYLMNPLNNPYNADGSYNIDLPYGSLPNIFYVLDNNYMRNSLTRGLINSKLDWELIDNLTFSNRIGLDYQLLEYKSYVNRHEGDGEDLNGYGESSDFKNFNLVYQSSLTYNFTIGENHNLNAMAIFEYQKNQENEIYAYGENYPTDGLKEIAVASANYNASTGFSNWYNVSYLGLLNYNYAGKYVVDATIRREGSSRFAPGKRFGTFGSVGAAWNIHMEDFMIDSPFNTLKLRTSYGITGNNGYGINGYQSKIAYGVNYAGNGGSYPSDLGNYNLEWEKGKSFDIGMNFGIWNNRLRGSFAYYNRETTDLIQDVPISMTTGITTQTINAGAMKNKGIEAELSYDVIQTKDFNWNVSVNYATVDNEVTNLAKTSTGENIDIYAGSSYKYTEIGKPFGAWYMRTWAGVDPQTGEPTWYVNGKDGAVTSNYNEAERVYQDASPLPTYSGGFGTRVEFKGFFANADFYFAGGHKIYEQYAQFYLRTNSFTTGTYNGVEELLTRWQEPGDITNVPKLAYNGSDNFHSTSSRHLYDGDFIRLRNVAIGYNLPSKFTDKIGLDGLTLTLRGTNLATWLKDDGLKLDPEVRADGYTRLTTPAVKSYTLSVNLKF